MVTGAIRSGGLVDEPLGLLARTVRFRCSLRTQNGVPECAIVRDTTRMLRQVMGFDVRARSSGREIFRLADGFLEFIFHARWQHPVGTGIVMHLAQIGTVTQSPGFRQLIGSASKDFAGSNLYFVQKPGYLRPTPEGLFQFYLVGLRRTEQHQELTRQRLLTNGLGTEKHRDDCLLQFPVVQTDHFGLNLPRLGQFALQDRFPLLMVPFAVVHAGVRSQFARSFRQIVLVRRVQEDVGSHQRACIPLGGISQRLRESTQNASRSLKTGELRPARV